MTDATIAAPSLRARLRTAIRRIEWILLFPIIGALAWGMGQDAIAMAYAIVLPLFLVLDGRVGRLQRRQAQGTIGYPDLNFGQPLGRPALQRIVDDILEDCARRDRTTAVLYAQVDGLHIADGEWGAEVGEKVMDRVVQRVAVAMRGQDAVMRAGDDGIVIVLAPTRRADLDVVMGIVDRVQAAVAEPVSLDGRSIRVHACIGICTQARAPARTGGAMLAAADCALRVARRQGDDAVRAFTADMQARVETDHRLSMQVEAALEAGDIRAWFQPQIDARTGRIVGFEALARWHHAELGVLLPAQFLPTITSAGRSGDLGEQILKDSLNALLRWDRAGLNVPCVGVNVSLEQLTDPRLAERIIWQLDRHDISPSRVAIEILETVTLRDGDETIMRNLKALRAAGFRLDLDDFGTGAASISHIARFGVHRIKIDRSFVHGLHTDQTQRDIIAAILGLAERLGIETLAEGVETLEEQEALAALGCPHLQGYGIARPMPLEDTIPWALSRPSAIADALRMMQPHGTA